MAGRPAPAASVPVLLQPAAAFAVVVLLTALRTWVAATTDLVPDEGYYTLWSLHLAPGYLDHPPAIAWMIAFGRGVLGDASLGVRLLPLLVPLLVSLALYRIGHLLCDRAVAGLAVLSYNLSIGTSLSLLATPDVPSTLFWTLALWAVAEFTVRSNANWWLLVGLFAGLGVLSKYTNLFLGLGLAAYLLSSAERRRWLLLPQLWLGGGIALLIVLPNLWWNWQHDWVGIWFQGRRIVDELFVSEPLRNYSDLLGGQALFLGPFTLLLFLVGTTAWLLRPRLDDHHQLALPVLTGLPALLYFLVHAARAHVEANWLLPLWPMLTLVAAWTALRLPRRRFGRLLGRAAAMGQILFGLVAIGLLQWVVTVHPPHLAHLDRTRDMHGWSDLRQQLDDLARAEGAHWIAVVENYELTGMLTSYGRFNGSELEVLSIGDALRYTFLPPLDTGLLSRPGLVVGPRARDLTPYFESIEELPTLERQSDDALLGSYTVRRVAEPTPEAFAAIGR